MTADELNELIKKGWSYRKDTPSSQNSVSNEQIKDVIESYLNENPITPESPVSDDHVITLIESYLNENPITPDLSSVENDILNIKQGDAAGKNLYPYDMITAIFDDDYQIFDESIAFLLNPGTYTFSSGDLTNDQKVAINFYNLDRSYNNVFQTRTVTANSYYNGTGSDGTITIRNKKQFVVNEEVYAILRISQGFTPNISELGDVQVERGEIATEYEAYIPSLTVISKELQKIKNGSSSSKKRELEWDEAGEIIATYQGTTITKAYDKLAIGGWCKKSVIQSYDDPNAYGIVLLSTDRSGVMTSDGTPPNTEFDYNGTHWYAYVSNSVPWAESPMTRAVLLHEIPEIANAASDDQMTFFRALIDYYESA